jgi:peroxiredoxin
MNWRGIAPGIDTTSGGCKRMQKRWGLWLAAALCAGTFAVVANRGTAQDAPRPAAQAAAAEKAEIDKPFRDFELVDLTSEDKKKVKLSSFKDKKVVVGIFMANRCGTTWTYEGKIGSLIKNYSPKGVQVMAIHSNFTEPDSEIVGQIEQRNLAMPVLDDKKAQSLANYVGARSTPTFFVVDKKGTLRYIGSFDDHGATPTYVPDALDAVLAGKEVTTKTTRAFG